MAAAVETGEPIVPVFIFAPEEEALWPPGGASRWWLHHSLLRLQEDLLALGSRLILRRSGDSLAELLRLAAECKATHVLWNRRYEPAAVARDARIKAELRQAGTAHAQLQRRFAARALGCHNQSGKPYRVFTAYWRHCLSLPDPGKPLQRPQRLAHPADWPQSARLEEWSLLPRPDWASGLRAAWIPGSLAARAQLGGFLAGAAGAYPTLRDRPDVAGTSRLSAHLHFGEISVREIWDAVRSAALARGEDSDWRSSRFLAELGWREFAHYLLYHFPQSAEEPLQTRFTRFPWRSDPEGLRAWQRGATGYPIVDAGMRQLWHTGWMHNRVRMIAASFLVKDLRIPWTEGARWFWDTLVDADLASNTLGWQWVAGCGVDAAPYFRIFNPVTQATRFDPDGAYVREWVPELKRCKAQWIHEPWMAAEQELLEAGVRLGGNYPRRIIDHDLARREALQAFAALGSDRREGGSSQLTPNARHQD